jgi:radical SAM protein with 4Fe4S-binding SPASM domain
VGGCGAGRLYCALEPNGDIEPCVFIPLAVGNIMRDDFLPLWRDHPVLRKIRRRENFKGYCGICKYRNLCGGCRARACACFGDLAESDPGCILNESVWQSIRRERMSSVKPMQVYA